MTDTPDLFDKPQWSDAKRANVPYDQFPDFMRGRLVFCVIVKDGYYQCDFREPLSGVENLFQPQMPWWMVAREEKKKKKKLCTKAN